MLLLIHNHISCAGFQLDQPAFMVRHLRTIGKWHCGLLPAASIRIDFFPIMRPRLCCYTPATQRLLRRLLWLIEHGIT